MNSTDWWCLPASVKEWRISFYKQFIFVNSYKPKSKIHPQKKTTKKKNCVGIYYLDLRAPSCLACVFMSFGIPQHSNSYSNSCVLAHWDLLWWPNSSASIPNERQPVPIFSCGLSAVCPLVDGCRESTQQPPSPPEGQLHRRGPTASC